MKIAFVDTIGWDYTPETPYLRPIGGMQSAACYLAEALTAAGNDVFYLCHTTTPGTFRGVKCLPCGAVGAQQLREMAVDALVLIQLSERGAQLRELLPKTTRLILWTQHAADQPQAQLLRDPKVRDTFDAVALVSDWQRREFERHFGLDPARTAVLRNAVAPCFENLLAQDEPILSAKSQPPVLVYTSTPFRGLRLLPEIFPRIRARVPGARLEIYSSMKVYHAADAEDQQQFGPLYDRLKQMEGVEYVGSLPQPQLAQRLRRASMLAYPNIFPETSCISVLEAMAAGCHVVTTQLAALPETTAGFAELISTAQSEDSYIAEFAERAIRILSQLASPSRQAASVHLRAQVDHVCGKCTWKMRAQQWTDWLMLLQMRR